ncbi:MAG: nucleotidyl transferase AbiEii/AbiGii toxin family protein [Alphaproteobacteria bacterium]|nr:nucleotidyl transferase AbiEii/AbiGii toxin family protein [Alphaproteobacteria bacterium]MBU1560728.1 nucleotidyl transferase AbiEii/AbiGii toxin family protein [Alphaproteobacteria bacterium]MBU2302937.1 nucleotidyl transferase AbiEii/AbiGii toxin family protein [Alphaproteobacteria bacterium]MBU2367664.1 nucleotidyl transferase AbiEii/AbiGii toxin family protein [Alphaproteobacteria bacterium]
MKFERPEHVIIAETLQSMDHGFLERSRCFFGGGTAIVLMNGEYRLSLDVDFLCADIDGYRELRSAIVQNGAPAVFGAEVETLREFKADQYGIRGLVALHGQRIKFEIVREARIALEGETSPFGVPMLTVESQFAEKLLANADRCLDKSVAYRDAIDLGYLVHASGSIPAKSIEVSENAYGGDILRSVANVLERLGKASEIEHAAETLNMTREDVLGAALALRDASITAWPGADLPEVPAREETYGR